jgi:DNA-binding NtrC family response regulator
MPENVRNLASVVRRARILATGKPIDVEHLLLTAPSDTTTDRWAPSN